jgi:clathrin heavy chain
LETANCIKIFESVSAFDGLYYFLGAILESTTDKDIHFKYIEAAVKVN